MEAKKCLDKLLSEENRSLEDIFDTLWNMNSVNLHELYAFSKLLTSDKSEEEANKLRNEGNKYYTAKDMEKALEFYNLSIMSAPHPLIADEDLHYLKDISDGDEFAFPLIELSRYGDARTFESKALAKGFANRSAVLFELHLYEKCMQDIDLALEFQYPEELRGKLELRRQRCIKSRESGLEYKPEIKDDLIGKEILAATLKQKNLAYFENYVDSSTDRNKSMSLNERLCVKLEKAPEILEVNPLANSLSSSVRIFHKEGQGRGLMAVKHIKAFEVIGVERALSCGLQENNLKIKCSTCFCICLTPIPCPGCSRVMFCSKSCRTRGLAEDHWLDCVMYPLLIDNGLGIAFGNRYKILKILSYQNLKEFAKKLDDEKLPRKPEYKGFSSKGTYSSTSYKSMHHLNYEMSGYPYDILVYECWNTCIVTKFLVMSGRFFISKSGQPLMPTKEEFLDSCRIIMENCVRKSINSHNMAQGKGDCWGVFPALCLLNHSCNPSAIFRSFGRIGYLFALRPIQVGEEVTVSYVGSYKSRSKEERQSMLMKAYSIHCKCEACLGNW